MHCCMLHETVPLQTKWEMSREWVTFTGRTALPSSSHTPPPDSPTHPDSGPTQHTSMLQHSSTPAWWNPMSSAKRKRSKEKHSHFEYLLNSFCGKRGETCGRVTDFRLTCTKNIWLGELEICLPKKSGTASIHSQRAEGEYVETNSTSFYIALWRGWHLASHLLNIARLEIQESSNRILKIEDTLKQNFQK